MTERWIVTNLAQDTDIFLSTLQFSTVSFVEKKKNKNRYDPQPPRRRPQNTLERRKQGFLLTYTNKISYNTPVYSDTSALL